MICPHEWIPPAQCPMCKDAEIERLRAENRSLHEIKRWNIKAGDAPGELLICVGEHDKHEPCDFHSYISNRRS